MDFFKTHTTAKILLLVYIVLFIVCAFSPFDRSDWWAENIPIMAVVLALIIAYANGVKFTATCYLLMSVLIFLHTIGGHYSFERVPFGFVTHLFGFHRNHYDRLAHFTVGFYGYAIAELLYVRGLVKNKLMIFLFAVFAIAFVAMSYELIEWLFAAYSGNPEAGAAFLGSQGDVWDAQKDMLSDTLGGIVASLVFLWQYRKWPIKQT